MTKEERDAVQARCVSIDNIIIGIEREINMLRTHLDILTKVCEGEPQLTAKCLNCANGGSYKCSKCDGEMYFKAEPQTERHLPDYSYEADLGRRIMEQTERSK